MSDTAILNRMADDWATRNGFRRFELYSGQQSIHPLFPGPDRSWEEISQDHYGNLLFDHSRAFLVGRFKDPKVFVSAPYENTLLRRIGDPAAVAEHIWAIAEGLGLRVRIGHAADRIYEVPAALTTLPIVWWRPEVKLGYVNELPSTAG